MSEGQLSLLVSGLVGVGLILLGWAQFRLHRRQRRLEEKLAKRQLDEYRELDAARQQANMRAEYERHDSRVYITNHGPAEAREVTVTATDAQGETILIDEEAVAALPYERIRAGERRQIFGRFGMGMEPPVLITLTWTDRAGPHEELFEQDPW